MSMEEELQNFLLERQAVSEDDLQLMKAEKIDIAVIQEMTEDMLKRFIPKLGDRMAVLRFCKLNTRSTHPKRLSLLERIRKQQQKQDETKETDVADTNTLGGKKHTNFKATRKISIGWIHNGKAVREVNGGGARVCSMLKEARREEILNKGLEYFFPNGLSAKGIPLYKYSYDLLDYKEHVFGSSFNVGDLYNLTGLNILRFYVSTKRQEEESSSEETKLIRKGSIGTKRTSRKGKRGGKRRPRKKQYVSNNSKTSSETDLSDFLIFNENPEKHNDDIFEGVHNSNVDMVGITETETNSSMSNSINLLDGADDEAETLYAFPAEDIFPNLHLLQNSPPVVPDTISQSPNTTASFSATKTLVLHRGQIFKEMTKEFETIDNLYMLIAVEIVDTNGKREAAVDGGGVFKDALSEYWNEFYDHMCEGSSYKIPEINYLYTESKWKSLAKILLMGFQQVRYFPARLPRPFIEYAIFGREKSDLSEVYLNFISTYDAEILKKALSDYESVESDDIIDVLTNLECKQIPNKDNLKDIVGDLAHTAIIQRPMYILDCWSPLLRNRITEEDLDSVYEKCKITNRSILQMIVTYVSDLSSEKEKVFDFLKRFVREADGDVLTRFLRFCTGEDVITCSNISVEFNLLTGAERRPTAHTCGNILVLPVSYANDNYRVFKYEFTNVLKSNCWRMDIV